MSLPNRDIINEQRIAAYQRIEELERELAEIRLRLKRRSEVYRQLSRRNRLARIQLNNAIRELAKRKPENLSNEEWALIMESRGICS